MSDKDIAVDQIRSDAISHSETYKAKKNTDAEFNLKPLVEGIVHSMPVLTKPVAKKLAQKVTDKVSQACTSSIWGK